MHVCRFKLQVPILGEAMRRRRFGLCRTGGGMCVASIYATAVYIGCAGVLCGGNDPLEAMGRGPKV